MRSVVWGCVRSLVKMALNDLADIWSSARTSKMRTRVALRVIVVLCAMTSSAVAQQQVIEWLAFPRNEETESVRRQQVVR